MSISQSSSSTPRTWLITGASSGIGLALARAAAKLGDNVVAVARHVDPLTPLVDEFGERVRVNAADVTDATAVNRVVSETVDALGRIDVVVPAAGIGVSAGIEEANAEQARAIFDVNVHGVLNVLRATLPVLRAQRSGHILQLSSFLGMTANPGSGLTAATKYAIEGLSQALIGELAPLGIHLTLVEPGLTATAFFANMLRGEPIADYERTVGAGRKAIGALPPSIFSSPERVADAIIAAVEAEQPPVRLPTGSFALQQMQAALNARQEELAAVATWAASVDAPAEVGA